MKAYAGVTVDHLYQDCLSLQGRLGRHIGMGAYNLGDLMFGEVDPYGTDICGLCVNRYQKGSDNGTNTL